MKENGQRQRAIAGEAPTGPWAPPGAGAGAPRGPPQGRRPGERRVGRRLPGPSCWAGRGPNDRDAWEGELSAEHTGS